MIHAKLGYEVKQGSGNPIGLTVQILSCQSPPQPISSAASCQCSPQEVEGGTTRLSLE